MQNHTIEILSNYDPTNTFELDISNCDIEGVLDLSEFTELTRLICSNNKITQLTNLSSTINYLDCSYNLIRKLNKSIIPKRIKILIYKSNPLEEFYYNPKINKYLPSKLTHLETHSECEIIENLPNSITWLKFHTYNRQIIKNLPNNLTHLILGCNYFKTLRPNLLPNTLTHLTLEFYNNNTYNEIDFNLDNLPNSLTFLKLDGDINISIDNLPNNLVHLELSNKYNIPIDNLPSSLKYLVLGDKFSHL